MFYACSEFGSSVSSYNLKENPCKLKVAAKKSIDNLENIKLLTSKSHILVHVVKHERKFEHPNFLDTPLYKTFNFIVKTFTKISSITLGTTLIETANFYTSFAFLAKILELKIHSINRTILTRK